MTDKGIPILFYSFLFYVQVLFIRGDLEMKVSSCPVARWSATGLKDSTEANYNPGGGGCCHGRRTPLRLHRSPEREGNEGTECRNIWDHPRAE